jgi:glycerol-3-phosphate acyltransferase PlsY
MIIIFAVLSYLLGSFPSGYLAFYLAEKKDIRDLGSRSMGATNVLRLKGWKLALPVMVADILKGFLPVFLALKLFPDKRFALLCGFLAVLGHCFPIFIKFKGGKGVATAVGVFSAVAPLSVLIGLTVFLLIIAMTRYVSLGSLLAVLSFPLSVFLLKGDRDLIYLSVAVFLIILIRHSGNIRRLYLGTEKRFGEKVR